ncbi:TPA: stationary-phase-induced ribosome-associated protein [Serratia marcescens]|nr:stationary-phase-induced ribosome-associated protein [Serratia marcescens]HEP0988792.1 stationary-phase-induced ribosome-associated protein [Serratia marcescens]
MAKRKSNRAARRILGVPYKVSNYRCRTPKDDENSWPTDRYRLLTRRQKRAAKVIRALRAETQGKHYEQADLQLSYSFNPHRTYLIDCHHNTISI